MMPSYPSPRFIRTSWDYLLLVLTAALVAESRNDTNTATHCNTLQHNATNCNTRAHTALCFHVYLLPIFTSWSPRVGMMRTLQHTATHCDTLQHNAMYCHTLHHTYCPLLHMCTSCPSSPRPWSPRVRMARIFATLAAPGVILISCR